MAIIPQVTTNVHAQITPEAGKSYLRTGKWDNDSVLKMVIQDTNRAENFELAKQWVMFWPSATSIYQSPFMARYWEGTQVERANVPFYTVATAINSLVPQMLNGIFYENPPFMIQERPGTTSEAARAVGAVLAFQLEDINFKESLRLGCINALLFGTNIWKWGYETFSRERKVYRRAKAAPAVKNFAGLDDIQIHPEDDDIIEQTIEEYVDRPFFEHIVNLRHVLVDPALNTPDIRKAKYVVHRLYMTWEDIDKLRERPGFDIPSREELLSYFFPPKEQTVSNPAEVAIKNPLWDARAEARYEETTVDPFSQPLEVLERWDNNQYMVVLQQKLVICNDKNPYGSIPFLSVGWWDVPEAFWSMGLAKTIGSEQRLQQGVTNAWLDNLALNLNGVFTKVRGKSVPTQSIRLAPGRIVDVDAQGDFAPMKRLDAIPEAGQAVMMSQARAESVSGANELLTQGSLGGGGRSSITRTASGVNALAAGSGGRIQDFVEKLANQVIIPFLYASHELNAALMPTATLRHILNEELEKQYKVDVVDIMNARIKFSILAAARLQARRNMAQSLPIMIQFLTNQQIIQSLAVEGKKVNIEEVLRMFYEVSDWKNYYDTIVDMTPQDQLRFQAQQPGAQNAAKAQMAAGLQQQKFQQSQQLLDQENVSKAAREVLRTAYEKSAEPEAVTGAPGTAGFGSGV